MAVLATMFGGTYAAFSGPSKAPAASPPINASSSDEADFIKYGPPFSTAAISTVDGTRLIECVQEIPRPSGSGREEDEALGWTHMYQQETAIMRRLRALGLVRNAGVHI